MTGLSYQRARYYDSALGKFISQDPAFLFVGDAQRLGEIIDRSSNMSGKINELPRASMNDHGRRAVQMEQFLSDPQNLNRYSYVTNNPINSRDPNGETEGAEKLVNYLSGRGWEADSDLIDLSKIRTTISANGPAPQHGSCVYIQGVAGDGSMLSAGGDPVRPSSNQRHEIGATLGSAANTLDVFGQAADMPGAAAGITLAGASTAAQFGHPEASASIIAAYPVTELALQAVTVTTTILSDLAGRVSNWFTQQ